MRLSRSRLPGTLWPSRRRLARCHSFRTPQFAGWRSGPADAFLRLIIATEPQHSAIAALPPAYAAWRQSDLGRITDALEQELILDLVGPASGLKVLDVGCGDGILALEVSRQGARVAGADSSERMIAAARARANQEGQDIPFQIARAENPAIRYRQLRCGGRGYGPLSPFLFYLALQAIVRRRYLVKLEVSQLPQLVGSVLLRLVHVCRNERH